MFMHQLKSLITDKTDRFNAEYHTTAYPVIFYFVKFSNYDIGYVKWHWHYSPQFVTAIETPVEVIVDQTRITLAPGESAFINSNRLHVIKSVDPHPDDVSISILFLPEFIASSDSIIYAKYIRPVIDSPNIAFIHFTSDIEWHRRVNEYVFQAINAQTTHNPGYELDVRNSISAAWLTIIKNIDSLPHSQMQANEIITQTRIKYMVSFIYGNYSKNITLAEIAASASVSKSECNRCFRKYFGITPFQFLNEHRIEHASQLLLTTSDSVKHIALSCGFEDASYFIRLFKKTKGMTPAAFRAAYTD